MTQNPHKLNTEKTEREQSKIFRKCTSLEVAYIKPYRNETTLLYYQNIILMRTIPVLFTRDIQLNQNCCCSISGSAGRA